MQYMPKFSCSPQPSHTSNRDESSSSSGAGSENSFFLVYGCDSGAIGCLDFHPERAQRRWTIRHDALPSTSFDMHRFGSAGGSISDSDEISKRGGGVLDFHSGSSSSSALQKRLRGSVSSLDFVDITADGISDVLVGRENGYVDYSLLLLVSSLPTLIKIQPRSSSLFFFVFYYYYYYLCVLK